MEPNRVIYERIGPELRGPSTPHSTDYHAPSQGMETSSSSWFPRHGRARRAFMWGIVSTILSGIGLLGLALFEQYNGMLSELRTDLKHFNETTSEYVKKDRLQRCWDRLKEASKEVSASAAARERLEQELKASERTRETMATEIQRMRERLSFLEGMKAARNP